MKKSIFGKVLFLIGMIFILLISFYFIRSAVIKRIYPLKYEAEIEVYSKEYDIDPYLVASIIWVESKYDVNAISESGAVGLMQIMPETGSWIASKIDMDDFDDSNLAVPNVNLKLGCWYIKYLDDRFDGDIVHILAAYNGGPNRVADWLENDEYSINRKLVDIPIKETDDYVRRVNSAYEIYTTYYTFE